MKTVLDTHTHTISSGHAYSTLLENFSQGKKIGLLGLGTTDHSINMPGGPMAFHFGNMQSLPDRILGIKSYNGIELNIMDINGTIDDRLENNNFSENLYYGIASLHPPCMPTGSSLDITKAIINTMKHKKVNIIGHLGDPRYNFHIDEVVKASIDTCTAIELNNSSLNPNNPRFDKEFVIKILESLIKFNATISFGSDAHFCEDIGNFNNILKLIENYNINEDKVICTDLVLFENFINAK